MLSGDKSVVVSNYGVNGLEFPMFHFDAWLWELSPGASFRKGGAGFNKREPIRSVLLQELQCCNQRPWRIHFPFPNSKPLFQ